MNPDLIRSVLLQFEDDGQFPTPFIPTGIPTEELPGLLEDLEKAGLLVLYDEGRGETGIFFLTMKGHDFAAVARNEASWESVKRRVVSSGGAASPQIVADLLTDRARGLVGLPPKGL